MDERNDRVERILGIYTGLMNGYVINKAESAQKYGVNERTIQRDIDDIRNYLEIEASNNGYQNVVVYDRNKKGYRLDQIYKMRLTNSEVLAICKILLDSRAFTKEEMKSMLNRLVDCCVPEKNRKTVTDLIRNEQYHYVEPHHHQIFIDTMWQVGQAIQQSRYIEIKYQGNQGSTVKTRKLMPLAIMFSEFYFYLAAFIDSEEVRGNFDVINDSFPTIYRIDKIQDLKILDEHYHIPYTDRFEEGEFRKRIQFMYGGKIQRLKFKYTGYDVNAVLDRLPTAKIVGEEEFVDENGKKRTAYQISAEVFGKGVDMWLRSQGDYIALG